MNIFFVMDFRLDRSRDSWFFFCCCDIIIIFCCILLLVDILIRSLNWFCLLRCLNFSSFIIVF